MITALLLAALLVSRPTTTCAPQGESRSAASSQQEFDSKRHAASAEEVLEIAKLIQDLALIDKPDFGLSSTMSGTQFAPIESSRTFGVGLLMVDHRIETSSPVRRLVELGPKALPALLQVLDDASKTKLVMEHDNQFGAMWYGHEVPVNAANSREKAALADHATVLSESFEQKHPSFHDRPTITEHTITRGDIAFVIIGQIVGRGYEAARYQPSGCMVINSPSHDHAIADAVRAIWSSDDPARMLFDSLKMDTSSPEFEGAQGALLRLAYYFGPEVRASLVQRIDALDVHLIPWKSPGYEEGWRKRDEANGGRSVDILAALATSEDAAVIEAIARVIRRTDDVAVLAACLSASVVRSNGELVITKASQFLAKPPKGERTGPYGYEYELLVAAIRFCPERSAPLFELWLGHDDFECRTAVIHALAESRQPMAWAVELLAPLLENKTRTAQEYGPSHHRHRIRVCDEAARALALHVPGATFEFEGDWTNLDAQIALLKRRIAGEIIEAKKPDPKPVIDLAAIPEREPLATFELDKIIGTIHGISDAKTLFAKQGWWDDTVAIDIAAQRIVSVTKIDDWRNDVSVIEPIAGDQILCYHGDKGEIVARDLRTGRELRRIATPFHGGDLDSNDPLHVRGWGDAFATADGKWLAALTPDGALHSVDLNSGEHRIVLRPAEVSEAARRSGGLVAVRGTSSFLVTCLDDDVPLKIWDLAAQTVSEIQHVPSDFWKAAWGKFAHHYVNEQHEIWNLETREPVPLHWLERSSEIAELVCDSASATAWIAMKDGIVYMVDLDTGAAISRLSASPTAVGLVRMSFSTDRKRLFYSGDQTEYDPKTRDVVKAKTRISIFDIADRVH